MTISELKRRLRRIAFHLARRKRAKWSEELMKELQSSFKYEPHPSFEDQPN